MKDYEAQVDDAASILTDAAKLVAGDRQKAYGNKQTNHLNIATLWNAYLNGKPLVKTHISPHDVAIMMILLKIARTLTGDALAKRDTYVDIAGYSAIAGVLASIEAESKDE